MDSKVCSVCKKDLPVSSFTKSNEIGRRPRIQSQCRSCNSEYMRNRIKNETKELRAARLARKRENWFRANYGISVADYDRMLAGQGGKCASCQRPPVGKKNHTVLHVDHDHATGEVRGLLCGHCNRSYGLLQEDPDVIWGLLIYARKNQRRHLKLVA